MLKPRKSKRGAIRNLGKVNFSSDRSPSEGAGKINKKRESKKGGKNVYPEGLVEVATSKEKIEG